MKRFSVAEGVLALELDFNGFYSNVQKDNRATQRPLPKPTSSPASPRCRWKSFFPFQAVKQRSRSFLRNFLNFEKLRKNESQGEKSCDNRLQLLPAVKLRKNLDEKAAALGEND